MLAQLKKMERSVLPAKGMFSFELTLFTMIRKMMFYFFLAEYLFILVAASPL